MVIQILYSVQSVAEYIILSFNDYMMAFIDLIAIAAIASCFAKTASEPPRRNWFEEVKLRPIKDTLRCCGFQKNQKIEKIEKLKISIFGFFSIFFWIFDFFAFL